MAEAIVVQKTFATPSIAGILPKSSSYSFSTRSRKLRNSKPCEKNIRSYSTIRRCNKMFVPGFSDLSTPENRASDYLHHFFTYIAVRIVLAQLESYNKEGYFDLKSFVDKTSLKDGDKFLAELMRVSPRHKGLAMRILEVRSAYAEQDFEWDNLKKLSLKVKISHGSSGSGEKHIFTKQFGARRRAPLVLSHKDSALVFTFLIFLISKSFKLNKKTLEISVLSFVGYLFHV